MTSLSGHTPKTSTFVSVTPFNNSGRAKRSKTNVEGFGWEGAKEMYGKWTC